MTLQVGKSFTAWIEGDEKNKSLLTFALARSLAPPICASIRWSQWMVDGTATRGRPLLMNWSIAIWAVASCMATRSGRSRRYVRPRSISWLWASSRWPYTIFSDSVSGRLSLDTKYIFFFHTNFFFILWFYNVLQPSLHCFTTASTVTDEQTLKE